MAVLKNVTVALFKDALVDLIGQPLSHDLIQLAEVKDNCIIRMLVRAYYQPLCSHTYICTCIYIHVQISYQHTGSMCSML